MRVDTSQRLQHTIHFADESTPTSKAKPAGAMGAEIWVKVAPAGDPPPADPGELTFLAVDTRTPYTTDFDGADAGSGGPLHAPLGQHDRRKGTVERDGQRDGRGVTDRTKHERTSWPSQTSDLRQRGEPPGEPLVPDGSQ